MNESINEKTDDELSADKSSLMNGNTVDTANVDDKLANPKIFESVKNDEEIKVKNTDCELEANSVILIENLRNLSNFMYVKLKEKLKSTGEVLDTWFDK